MRFMLVSDKPAALYADAGDWEGVALAMHSLQGDIETVSGKKPELFRTPEAPEGIVLCAGTIGRGGLIDRLAAEGKLDLSAIQGRWESYIITVLDNPLPGVCKALVIAGSDKRGTIYGIYKISERIGVSPWHWWADSPPEKQETVCLEDIAMIQGEPSVKYRGFFLNDEAPSLTTWVRRFGGVANTKASPGYNSNFYVKVFELLLRLRANYLWPAMWNNAFNTDDPENAVLADRYGIVMGSSHHEPMHRADKEWNWTGRGEWNYYTNRNNIREYWRNGIKERAGYEAVITIGMRGQADTSMLPDGSSLAENVALLNDIISDQREIIAEAYGTPDGVPQLWALYKEVEDYYYGEGMNVPQDVTLLLCDDNFGNLRTLPSDAMRNHPGGFGMYYHFDYVGGPISYKWLNTIPLTKIWEQMTTAYDYGVDRVWIVNVGDLKPMELPLEYFLSLSYDYEKWSQPNKTREFTEAWCRREFGSEYAAAAADVLESYTRLNGARKPEVVSYAPSTYSLHNYGEAERVLRAYAGTARKAEELYMQLPERKRDAFYQLVLYPARASYNVLRFNITAALHGVHSREAIEAFESDRADRDYYNNVLSGGKWRGMMSQNHIGYTVWNSATNGLPLYDSLPAFRAVPESPENDCTGDYVSINPSRYSVLRPAANGAAWTVLYGFGRDCDGLKVLPNRMRFENTSEAPRAEYRVRLKLAGTYRLWLFTAPSNNPEHASIRKPSEQLRLAASIDNGAIAMVSSLPPDYSVANNNPHWAHGVLQNTRVTNVTEAKLEPGFHSIYLYGIDPGVVVTKIVLTATAMTEKVISEQPYTAHFGGAYLGPPENLKI